MRTLDELASKLLAELGYSVYPEIDDYEWPAEEMDEKWIRVVVYMPRKETND